MFTEGCVFERNTRYFLNLYLDQLLCQKCDVNFIDEWEYFRFSCTAYNVSIFRIESHSKLIYLSNLNLISIKESFGALDFCIWTLSSWIWCFGSNFETYICWVERTVPWPRPISKCKCFEFAQARRKFYRATDVELVNNGCCVIKSDFDYVVLWPISKYKCFLN